MVSKRKAREMALMGEDAAITEEITACTRPDVGPRRSGRKLHNQIGVGLVEGVDHASEDSFITRSTRTQAQKQKKYSGKDGVDVAMDGLQSMEEALRESVKRQKRAIDSSKVMDNFTPKYGDIVHAKVELDVDDKPRTKGGRDQQPDTKSTAAGKGAIATGDPEGGAYVPEDVESISREGARPPPVNSDYLPLPWKGRLGYACLNTYLRTCKPPVFSSRTCRIASILEHRHPLQDPSQPEHPTKNRPDKSKPSDVARGQKYVESLGLANARDIAKMLRWNDKYGIKFMRLSSEMFPFASHEEYGYKLAPFASEVLADAGKVAAELGHRLTTHPGQFTQLGSPRKEVIQNAIRDLEYHDELLSLLRLPEQANKDAVMILHMGGMYGDKAATLDRFRENYAELSPGIKARLVLENDDVSWSVHDLLPICEELNIPMVLDFHHHNIIFDKDEVREGTKDIMELYPRIKATWDRKGITQKMHYSEPCPGAITSRQRRKHRPRVLTLPPCANDMDLMIEAKDKEQSVFDLMRTFKLPGFDSFNDIIPHERDDENKPATKLKTSKSKAKNKKGKSDAQEVPSDEDAKTPPEIPEEEIGMGGPERRVYWPLGMEEWLKPKKREIKRKKDDGDAKKEEEEEDGDEC